MAETNGVKNDYRALIRYLSGIIGLIILAVFGFVVNAQVKLTEKVDCKVEKTQYAEDKREIKTQIKEVDKEVKEFRKEVRMDFTEIKQLIRDMGK